MKCHPTSQGTYYSKNKNKMIDQTVRWTTAGVVFVIGIIKKKKRNGWHTLFPLCCLYEYVKNLF